MAGVKRTRWDGPPIPVTELLMLYRCLRRLPEQARLDVAKRYAGNPDELVATFDRSVRKFRTYGNAEGFHERHEPREPLDPEAPIVTGKDVVSVLTHSGDEGQAHAVDGMPGLRLRVLDYEVEPARTTGSATFEDGARATSGMTLDVLMADDHGVPAVCEVKTPGDMDPFFALIQALACAAHLSTPCQMMRVGKHIKGVDPFFERLDVFVIQLRPDVERNATYQPKLRETALRIAERFDPERKVATRIRHLAILDATLSDFGLSLAKACPDPPNPPLDS